jgi:flagellar basal body-associated protein FliL
LWLLLLLLLLLLRLAVGRALIHMRHLAEQQNQQATEQRTTCAVGDSLLVAGALRMLVRLAW